MRDFLKGRQVSQPTVGRAVALLVEKLLPMSLLVALALTQRPALAVVAAWFGVFLVAGCAFAAMNTIGHYVETTEFPSPDADGKVARDWAAAQAAGSADVVIRNPILSWYFGGLNYHTEHHLFPRMAHRNFEIVQPVVAETCAEYGVPYHLYPSLAAVYGAHFRHLRSLRRAQSHPAAAIAAPAA